MGKMVAGNKRDAAMSESVVIALYLQLAILAICAYLFGEFAQRLRLPMVVGEMLVGVVLGPTILKRLLPGAYQIIAPNGISHPHLLAIASLAVALLLFSAGLELEPKLMRSAFRPAWKVGLGGFAVPFLFGFVPALVWPNLFGLVPGANALIFAIFVGAVLSVTALSVLVKMLMDLNIYKTPFGMMIVSAAVMDNLMSWTLVGFVFGLVGAASASSISRPEPMVTFAGSLLFVVLMFTVGRFILDLVIKGIDRFCTTPGAMTGVIIGLALLAASFSRAIGLDGIFGAFITGGVIGSCHLKEETRQSIKQFVSNFLAPVYFAFLGMRVDFIANFDWAIVSIVLILACAGKILGCFLAARNDKIPVSAALAAGLAMNSRGALAIILAGMGREVHLIDDRMFVALAIMALATSIIAGLALRAKASTLADVNCLAVEGV
jgi:Kef-type K+ transport system membrane component KefB